MVDNDMFEIGDRCPVVQINIIKENVKTFTELWILCCRLRIDMPLVGSAPMDPNSKNEL